MTTAVPDLITSTTQMVAFDPTENATAPGFATENATEPDFPTATQMVTNNLTENATVPDFSTTTLVVTKNSTENAAVPDLVTATQMVAMNLSENVAVDVIPALQQPAMNNIADQTNKVKRTFLNIAANGSNCSPYTVWPAISGAACGGCRALVPTSTAISCDAYCRSFNHSCIAAGMPLKDTCKETRNLECMFEPFDPFAEIEVAGDVEGIDIPISLLPKGNNNMLCTCGLSTPSPPTSRCDVYPQWPTISVSVCGNCTAVVNVNIPTQPFKSCQSFCKSFNHVCESAAVGSTTGSSPCSNLRPLGCMNSTEGLTQVLCTCVYKETA